jgi:hypothetical protein
MVNYKAHQWFLLIKIKYACYFPIDKAEIKVESNEISNSNLIFNMNT